MEERAEYLGREPQEAGTGKLTGYVRDAETGEVICGAKVMLSAHSAPAYTDADGQYHLSGVQRGAADFLVGAAGYVPQLVEQLEIGNEEQSRDFNLKRAVPVLLYHNIDYNAPSIFRISPDNLRDHLAFLKRHGYVCLTMEKLIGFVRGEATPPARSFVLTFDDNEKGILRYGYPLVAQYGCMAYDFVMTGSIGKLDRLRDYPALMFLESTGLFSIESHTVHHPSLSKLPPERIRWELAESKAHLEKHLGKKKTRYIAYPSGADNALVRQIAEEVGYDAGLDASYDEGLNERGTDLYGLKRATILGIDTLQEFQLKIGFLCKRHPYDPYIIDNESPGFSCTGSWALASYSREQGFHWDCSYGFTYRHKPLGDGKSKAVWRPYLECAGRYEVFAWWDEGPERASAAEFRIYYAMGNKRVVVDQRTNGDRWNSLGDYRFPAGSRAKVTLSDKQVRRGAPAADGDVVADAIKFQPIGLD
jgi:peptidoglycan/xylan/chitin deacetylase (PgdA/CDA1 family)